MRLFSCVHKLLSWFMHVISTGGISHLIFLSIYLFIMYHLHRYRYIKIVCGIWFIILLFISLIYLVTSDRFISVLTIIKLITWNSCHIPWWCVIFCWFYVVAFLHSTLQTVCAHTLPCAEFPLTKAAEGVNPLCLFSHTGYLLCSCLPSRSVYPKRDQPRLLRSTIVSSLLELPMAPSCFTLTA